jgi:uncharacterized iron-regulated membrane protein
MRPAARRWWLRLHRWLGLGLAAALALSGLTGACMIVLKPLQPQLHPALYAAPTPQAPRASLNAVRQSVVARYGPHASFTLRPPRAPDDTLWVRVGGAWNGNAFVDPATARILGQRGEYEGAANFLFELHSALLLGDDGKPLLALAALSYLFLLATGVVLWWPRQWSGAWKLRLDAGTTRSLFDLHRTAGALAGIVIAVSVASGAYIAWKPLSRFVTSVSGARAIKPPAAGAPASGEAASLDAMALQAQSLFPQAAIGYIQLAADPSKPVRFRMKLPDDPHPNGLTSVWFHPASGKVLAVHRWDQLDPGAKLTSFIYPLHTGELGGAAHQALNAASGVTLFGLGLTGCWLWWRRRSVRANQKEKPAADLPRPAR